MYYLNNTIKSHIIDNINFAKKPGMIIASPSLEPDYNFHWTRDSALVMRVFIDLYQKK
uniref:GH15-like domain-containing protein n=1 Tax=viral metagenome TaxID=1070528 RepID=A0A6C0IYC0_9ZZZZ